VWFAGKQAQPKDIHEWEVMGLDPGIQGLEARMIAEEYVETGVNPLVVYRDRVKVVHKPIILVEKSRAGIYGKLR